MHNKSSDLFFTKSVLFVRFIKDLADIVEDAAEVTTAFLM